MSVTVYHIGPSCVQCNQTKRLLTQLEIEFDEVDLREHPELAEEFKKAGHLTAPIVIAGSKTWSGFKYEKIKALALQPTKEKEEEPKSFTCHGVEWETGQTCYGCDVIDGVIHNLKALGVVRDSMLPGWYVIYTDDGATDITPARLKEALGKRENK